MFEIGRVPAGGEPVRSITPTDVSQFVRLEQCQRYLRLRLWDRTHGPGFLYDYGVKPQSIPPILTLSGASFEERIEQAVTGRFRTVNFATEARGKVQRPPDNEHVVARARCLGPDETVVLFQPRLHVPLGKWFLRGDVDILRLERDTAGELRVLITDMKSSTHPKVEHRLQVAFYWEMLSALFETQSIAWADMAMGVLYRGPADEDAGLSEAEIAEREAQRDAAESVFGSRYGFLEIVADPDAYRGSVRELVTGPDSAAECVSDMPFEEVPYHLAYKCDGCLYNEFCLKWSAEHDDLSLVPHLSTEEKNALLRAGVASVRDLASLKTFAPKDGGGKELVCAPGKEPLVARLAATWPVGTRLDELIFRARRYRKWKKDPIEAPSYLPNKGYGSLPYSDAQQNPNLVRVYIDAQHDYLQDRVYLLGALVAAADRGEEPKSRRRSIVHLLDGPANTAERERELMVRFVQELMRTIVEVAAPDAEGKPRAPIHLIFFNRFDQRLLLDALSRHFTTILEATPLYDFVTQLASFDSPIVTFLDEEIRELKNFPMVCQSLQAVAAFLGFDWNEGVKYREIFRARMFDFWRKLDEPPPGETPWYTSRARFNSQIPLEYAYAAWDQLPIAEQAKRDDFASYRGTTRENLEGFHERRLEALEHVAKDFAGNKYTAKSSFDLPDLSVFEGMAHTLAQAIDEFVTVERHVELADWKSRRLLAPERRVLAGDALIVRYLEEDQDPGAAERNRENACRKDIRDRIVAEWRAEHPDERLKLTKEQNAECKWSQEGMIFRLRLECAGVDCDLDEILRLTTFREGDYLCLFERWTVDSRLPEAERKPFQPTPKQLLYAMRVTLKRVVAERNASGGAVRAFAEVEMGGQRGGTSDRGFTFGTINERPLDPGELYTLDSDPNDWYGFFCAKVTEELCGLEASSPGAHNAVYDRLAGPRSVRVSWPPQAEAAQLRFLDGLDALQRTGVLHPFDDRQRAYIAEYGAEATLLVQGPPGTGKSYTTAYALLARLQGAFSAGLDYRVIVSAKTHAATDVLLKKLVEVRHLLLEMRCKHPEIFSQHFDERVLSVPLFRAAPKSKLPDGVRALPKKEDRAPGEPLALDAIRVEPHCIVAATPGGVYRMLKDKGGSLFGRELCDCLVLDEASQMNLPEAIMTSLPLKREARLIVVGDHRQMPPIVKHDWSKEPRRTFQEFRSYESLFLALLPLAPPMVKLAESFRLHADMAEFLRAEVYAQDGIPYFSRKREKLLPSEQADPFVASVLAAEHTIVVIVHNEDGSMLRNPFEQRLITPVLEALAGQPYHLDPRHGLGVVVPHRAQRAALQEAVPCLSTLDPTTGTISLSAVDTVERFQGDERDAIMVSATESDRDYLLLSSDFLLDPRRLTVALSRAKHKMILVASRSVFNLFSSDEETFANSQLWKKLLRKWCTVKVWEGERDGKWVEVWGNGQTLKDELSTNAVDVAARERAVEWAEGLLDQR